MNDDNHILMCIMGRTGSGKDTLVNNICERKNFKSLISYTTRPRRDNEGNTHLFVTEEEYNIMAQNNEIAAWTQIGEYKYWATISQLYEADYYIIDYEGIKTLRNLKLSNLHIVTVFINVPDDVREDRVLNIRKDDKNTFRRRDFAEREQFREMIKKVDYDYSISNIDFAKAYSVLSWISMIEGLWKNHQEDTME